MIREEPCFHGVLHTREGFSLFVLEEIESLSSGDVICAPFVSHFFLSGRAILDHRMGTVEKNMPEHWGGGEIALELQGQHSSCSLKSLEVWNWWQLVVFSVW